MSKQENKLFVILRIYILASHFNAVQMCNGMLDVLCRRHKKKFLDSFIYLDKIHASPKIGNGRTEESELKSTENILSRIAELSEFKMV